MAQIPVKQIDFSGGLPSNNLTSGILIVSGGILASGSSIDFGDATSIVLPGGGEINAGGSGIFRTTGSFQATTNNIQITGSVDVSGSMDVNGTLIVDQLIVSTSVIQQTLFDASGSSMFGNTLDDLHRFTGSVAITGSFTVEDDFYHYKANSANDFVYNDTSKRQQYVSASVDGEYLIYTGSAFEVTNQLDGGSF